MNFKKTIKSISNAFNFTINCVFITSKFVIAHMFTIYNLLEHYIEKDAFNYYDFFVTFTLPPKIISIIKSKITFLHTKRHQNELDQNKEIIKHVSAFFEQFTFINNFIIVVAIIINVYLIKTSYTYGYFFHLN